MPMSHSLLIIIPIHFITAIVFVFFALLFVYLFLKHIYIGFEVRSGMEDWKSHELLIFSVLLS